MVYFSADYTESIVAVGKNSAASIDNSSDVCLMSDLFENIFKFILFLDDIQIGWWVILFDYLYKSAVSIEPGSDACYNFDFSNGIFEYG